MKALCKQLPREFATYLNYCRNLKFDHQPDYTFLRELLQESFAREAYIYDFVFDWTNQDTPQEGDTPGRGRSKKHEKRREKCPTLKTLEI